MTSRSEAPREAFHGHTPSTIAARRIARAVYEASGVSELHSDPALLAPLTDFLNRPGKSFRGGLVSSAWEISGGARGHDPLELSLALELLHAGSLIVDDIEDESAMRRGQPALHHLIGMPLALNTGNWLYFAAETLVDEVSVPAETKLRLLRHLRTAILYSHQGQALDLSARISTIPPGQIAELVAATTALKTGALFELAARLGAVAGGASPEVEGALACFSRDLGSALQMFDDLGGITAPERREKGLEDLRGARPTWIWAWAAKTLPEVQLRGLQHRLEHVEQGACPDALLGELKTAVGHSGFLEASSLMRRAYRRLADSVPPSRALDNLVNDMRRLEASYV